MKKFVALILSALVCTSPVYAYADDSNETPPIDLVGDSDENSSVDDSNETPPISLVDDSTEYIQFTMVNESELWVSGLTESVENLVIPAYADGLPVVGIDSYAFMDYSNSIKSAVIPETVKYINEGAFSYCSNMESLTISNGVEYIGELAFSGCSALENVTLPESVLKIDDHAFNGCDNLQSITIQNPDCEIFAFDYTSKMLFTNNIGIFNKNFKSLGKSPVEVNVYDFEIPYENKLISLMNDYDASYNSLVYWLYDLDKDNTPELIVKTGASEADYALSFYKYQDNTVSLIDTMSGSYSSLYVDIDNNQLCSVYGHMGNGGIIWLSSDGNSVSDEKTVDTVYNEETGEYVDSSYGNFKKLDSAYSQITDDVWEELDMSLIKNYVPDVNINGSDIIIPSDTLGDVNNDGVIDANDASAVLSAYSLLSTSNYKFSDEQVNTADVNGDGAIDANDASAILAYYSYLSTLPSSDTPISIKDYINQ